MDGSNRRGRLSLRGRGLVTLARIIFPDALIELDVRDNALTDVGELRMFPELRVLLLGRNVLQHLGSLHSLQRLEVLDLSDNKLQKVQLDGLPSLRILNLAGNCISTEGDLSPVSRCRRLIAVDVSRNRICSPQAISSTFSDLPLKLLSLIGNPCEENCRELPAWQLCVLNAQVVPGREQESAELQRLIPRESGILWFSEPQRPPVRSLQLQEGTAGLGRPISLARAGPTDSVSSIPAVTAQDSSSGAGGEPPPAAASSSGLSEQRRAGGSTSPRDSAADRDSHQAAERQAGPIMDSADDMTSGGRTPYSSASEFGANTNFGALPSQNLPGLADRQDSANYQPRPPALAERQDSAQNLQALAEAEAGLGMGGEPPPLTRTDSAQELDEGSPSSPSARARLLSGRSSSLRRSLSRELRSAATHTVSPRQDSASEREALGRGGLESARSVLSQHTSRSASPVHRGLGATPGQVASPDQAPVNSESAALEANPLEAARLLHQEASPMQPERDRPWPSPFHSPEFESFAPASRQDSALDSLAEARRAVLADLPRGESEPIATSDPLQQARQLLHNSTMPSPQSVPMSIVLDRTPSARLARTSTGQDSPFERTPLTPLSPQWTASQLPPSFSQQLPRIASGVPWMPSGSLDSFADGTRISAIMSAVEGADLPPSSQPQGLLAEARKAVFGRADGQSGMSTESYNTAAAPNKQPVDFDSPEDRSPKAAASARLRETSYPDSPLAAQADSSFPDLSSLQHWQAVPSAFESRSSGDIAESSRTATGRKVA